MIKYQLENAFCTPSLIHWMGCDAYGVDLTKRLLQGAAFSIQVGFLVASISIVIGLCVGSLAVFLPPAFQMILSRFIDSVLAFPGFLLAILLASLLPPSSITVVFTLCVTSWASHARFFSALIRKINSMPYLEAARSCGLNTVQLFWRHILPGLWGQLFVQFLLSFGSAILGEASLSFLGLGGGSLNNQSWGMLISEGRDYLVEATHISIFSGTVLFLTLAFLHVLAVKLRNKLDPAFSSRV